MTATETRTGSGTSFSPLVAATFLAVILVSAKVAHWGWPTTEWLGSWVRDVFASAASDVAFACAFGVLASLLLHVTKGSRRLHRLIAAAVLTLGVIASLYAVVSVRIFEALRSPLTYPLLSLASDMKTMGSSIGSFLSWQLAAAFVLVPLGWLVAVRRWPADGGVALRRPAVAVALVAGALAWSWAGTSVASGRWSDRSDSLIAKSPHYEFLASAMREALGQTTPSLDIEFPRDFLNDFSSRPGTPSRLDSRPRPKNVVLVVLESTGAHYLSLYGSPWDTTPNLVREARSAMVFDAGYCHVGLTANSLAAITLSLYPYMTWREYTEEYPDFPGESVADVLGARSYRTSFFLSGHLAYTNQGGFLAGRGFGTLEDWKDFGGREALNSWGGTDDRLIDRAFEWIDAGEGQPFYSVLWTTQSHHPYDPVPGSLEIDFFRGQPEPVDAWDLGRYLNTVRYVDTQLGRLFDGLRSRGLADDTVVVITGDHGETFGAPHDTWGHGFRLYEEGIRVPLVVWSPRLFMDGSRSATVGGHVDISPTILDLLGVPAPASWQGRSLFATERPGRAYFYAANDLYLLGVREGRWKFVYDVTRGRDTLYDLQEDPSEQRNVASQNEALCRTYRQRVAAWKTHASRHLAEAQPVMAARRAQDTASPR
jgi:arylsulfatase A-like enzyme